MSELRKIVIVDDEQASRQLLKEYISDYDQLQLLAECKNGIEAVGVVNALKPDIVMLDIQMPGKSGFDVLQELEFFPTLIFTTAFDQYALKAFEVNAVDYLLKPYTRERFKLALDKALQSGDKNLYKLFQLTESLQLKKFPERILVEHGNRLVNVAVKDIYWLEAEGDYTKLHTASLTYLSNKGISELEQRLDPQQFQRLHRSAIVNLHAIREVYREPGGPQVVLQNNTVIKVSRSYTEALKKWIF
jgi:two-component system LytT family response regulator